MTATTTERTVTITLTEHVGLVQRAELAERQLAETREALREANAKWTEAERCLAAGREETEEGLL